MANDELDQLANQIKKPLQTVGEMHKRSELMADGRRYIIYYTFGEKTDSASPTISEKAVSEMQES